MYVDPPGISKNVFLADLQPRPPAIPWRGFALAAALLVVFASVLVVTGWALAVESLTRPLGGVATMKMNTAIAVLLLGLAIVFSLRIPDGAKRDDRYKWLVIVPATIAATIGLISLIEHVFKLGATFDDLIVNLTAIDVTTANRPATLTSTLLLTSGLASVLLVNGDAWAVRVRQSLASFTFFGGYAALLGHIYDADQFFGVRQVSAMAVVTALCILLTGAAILMARPGEGWMSLLTTGDTGSSLALRLLPAIIVGIPLIGLGRVQGTRSGLFDAAFGTALAAAVTTTAVGALIVWIAVQMNREQSYCEQTMADRRRTEKLLEGLVENTESLVSIRDLDGRLILTNETYERWAGVRREDAIGKTLFDVLPPNEAEPRARELERVIHGGEPVHNEMTYKRGGLTATHNYDMFPIRDDRGRTIAAGLIATDVTERKWQEEDLKQLNVQLQHEAERTQEAIAELRTFAYTVSHDLRSPLRAIDGFSQVVDAEYAAALDDRGRHYIERMRAGVHEMNELIDDLIDFSRISRAELRLTEVDMSASARRANDALIHEREGRDVRVTFSDLPEAIADEHFIGVVFANLLSNAHKYTRSRETAEIVVGAIPSEQGRPPTYFVRDNGVGFDMRHQDKLFRVFERLHHDGSFEGSGVGLATVERILRRHGGCVWAYGEPGVGATVYFQLAREQAVTAPEKDES